LGKKRESSRQRFIAGFAMGSDNARLTREKLGGSFICLSWLLFKMRDLRSDICEAVWWVTSLHEVSENIDIAGKSW